MMATDLAVSVQSVPASVAASVELTVGGWRFGARSASNLHDLRFLVLQKLVDVLRVVVGELLHLRLGTPFVVVADVPVAGELLEVPEDGPPHFADGDAVLL